MTETEHTPETRWEMDKGQQHPVAASIPQTGLDGDYGEDGTHLVEWILDARLAR